YREELQKAVTAGFDAKEIAAAKDGWLREERVSRTKDDELAHTLTSLMDEGRTLSWIADLEAKMAALDAKTVGAAFATHLKPSEVSVVTAGDFAGAKKRMEAKAAAPAAQPIPTKATN